MNKNEELLIYLKQFGKEKYSTKFNANNPEENCIFYRNRINRLHVVYEYLMRKHGVWISDQIVEMYDHKGYLFVHWKDKWHYEKRRHFYVEDAWKCVGFELDENVKHSYENVHGNLSGKNYWNFILVGKKLDIIVLPISV